MGATRARRRSKGKREARREAHRNVVRVVELHRKGFSLSTIAATVRIRRAAVELILERAAAVEEAEAAAGEAGEGGGA